MTNDRFDIKFRKYGIIFEGLIPVCLPNAIYTSCSEYYNYDIFDFAIAQHLGATLVLTSKENSKLWRKELCIEE